MPFDRWYRESVNYRKSLPQDHENSLEQYLTISPFLVPDQKELHKPVLRHPDLQPNNMFVSESLDILSLIDCQHSSILPCFFAAGIPKYFQNYRDEESQRFTPPKLPENVVKMDEESRTEALEQYGVPRRCESPPRCEPSESPSVLGNEGVD